SPDSTCSASPFSPPTPSLSAYSSFSITPPPPTSPLFPYTTLFRSLPALPASCRAKGQARPLHRARPLSPIAQQSRRAAAEHAPRDRKSTRLNSSHGSISYAVFCLKKKKNTTTNQRDTEIHYTY